MANDDLWRCPHCDRDTTITQERVSNAQHRLEISNSDDYRSIDTTFVVCPNKSCQRVTVVAHLSGMVPTARGRGSSLGWVRTWRLIPNPQERDLPPSVPEPIRQDYREASLIRDLSPKAAATLARRAIQGMIHDFHGIQKRSLFDELTELRAQVDAPTWGALDAARKVGNIGAHMERDVNLIIDVDPQEAEHLLRLVALLARDWYEARAQKDQLLTELLSLGEAKDAAKKRLANPEQ